MPIIARVTQPEHVRRILRRENASIARIDRQTETWFPAPRGRLVLREADTGHDLAAVGPDGVEYPVRHQPDSTAALKEVLLEALGALAVVEKQRETFTLRDTRVHLDEVEGLGTFAQIEAIDDEGTTDERTRHARCLATLALLGLTEQDLIPGRYVDLLLG